VYNFHTENTVNFWHEQLIIVGN